MKKEVGATSFIQISKNEFEMLGEDIMSDTMDNIVKKYRLLEKFGFHRLSFEENRRLWGKSRSSILYYVR